MLRNVVLTSLLMSLTPAIAFSAPSDLDMLKSLMESPALGTLSADMSAKGFNELVRVEKTQAYRCYGKCYQYTATFQTYDDSNRLQKSAKISVAEVPGGQVRVEIQKVSDETIKIPLE